MSATVVFATSELPEAATQATGGDLIAGALLLVIGLVLWSAGRMILRPAVVVLGLAIGGLSGWVATDQLNLGLSPWIAALAAAVVLGVLSLLMYRIAVMAALAILLAAVIPICVLSVWQFQTQETATQQSELTVSETENVENDEISNWLDEHFGPESNIERDDAGPTMLPEVAELLDVEGAMPAQADEATTELSDEIAERIATALRAFNEEWKKVPSQSKPTFIACAVIGAAGGLLIGMLSATFSVSVLTAVGGSILALAGLRLLMIFFGVPEGVWHPTIDVAWLSVWLITSLAGLWIQWTSRPETADKSG